MVWYLGLLICAVLAYVLAVRSMRDYQEAPDAGKKKQYGLFLISHLRNLTPEVFSSLLNDVNKAIFSLEQLTKGENQVVVAYLPYSVVGNFPSLGLVEIEDYLADKEQPHPDERVRSRQITIDESFAWQMAPKKKQESDISLKKPLHLNLEPSQYLVIQSVAQPTEKGIQLTVRALVRETDPQQKINLIKKTKTKLLEKTNLFNNSELLHATVYHDFKKRTLIPKTVSEFTVSSEALLKFIIPA